MNKRANINPVVFKSEIELLNPNSCSKCRQNLSFYEFDKWPIPVVSGEFSTEGIKNFLNYFCLVRRELNLSKDELTIIVQDDDGGVGPAALWVGLDEVLPTGDDIANTSNKDYGKLDVFDTVNNLRKQRSKMVNSFTNYKLLFELLQHYVQYKPTFDKVRSE